MDSSPTRVSAAAGYQLWSQTWDADPSPIVALESRFLWRRLAGLASKIFLDVACGTGRWMVQARAQGASVIGVDFCREMLLQASRKAALGGRLILADSRRLPIPDRSADVVLCALSLGHMPPVESVIFELARVVRPQGVVIASDFHPEASRRGWKRTFRSGSQVYEVENHPYTREQLIESGRSAGLELQELLEPCFGEPEREIFRRAGKENLFDGARGIPAVLIAFWKGPV